MNDLAHAFEAVSSALDQAGLHYVVVGSVAAAGWGAARTTRDVDLAVQLDSVGAEAFLASLDSDAVYVPTDTARAALLGGGSFNVLHTATGGKVDIFVVLPEDAFEASRLRRRVAAEVLGVPSWIATAEDVVLSKLKRRLESRSEVQWRDCVEIAAVNDLDRDCLRRWAKELGVGDDLADLLGNDPLPL